MNCRITTNFAQLLSRQVRVRRITTKQPTPSTATAPQVQPSEEQVQQNKNVYTDEHKKQEEVQQQSEKWQAKTSKYSTDDVEFPVHTCMTLDEHTENFRLSVIKFNPQYEKQWVAINCKISYKKYSYLLLFYPEVPNLDAHNEIVELRFQ